MDVQSYVREQEDPELPSQAIKEQFELWHEEYTVDSLSDLTPSKLDLQRADFEGEVGTLLAKHNPGKQIANRPALAYVVDKPPYTAEEWERAREMIRNEAKKVRLRFDRAESIVGRDQTERKREWIIRLVDSLPSPNFNLNLR
ncbi:hypothetical protein [Haloplanus vescus]|uniref:hypothetical protein n=1 Tax=Haloplanus vescus TaxID=555874 RepID=UPI00115FB5F3|nr:hypothetical protein [Haloplanus vescus]